jgi:hypothetical protein
VFVRQQSKVGKFKAIQITFCFFLACFYLPFALIAQENKARCLTDQVHRYRLLNQPGYAASIEAAGMNRVARASSSNSGSVTIPVVIHVLYNTPEQNISDEQIVSQLDVLNEDYAFLNPSSLSVPDVWKPKTRDSGIRFVLARRDPSGMATNGILRVNTPRLDFQVLDPSIFQDATGGHAPWPFTDYLNIWVCNLEGNALGFSSFPGSSGNQDGIVIDYQAFGRKGTVKPPYDVGRTATHEIGHWLSLIHIWGDAFCGNDLVDDTPVQEKPTFRCRTFPYTDDCSTVSPGIMFMNYMDYTDDGCMQFFTDSQMLRMQSVLDNFRFSIRNSSGLVLPMPYVHDVEIDSVLAPVKSNSYRCLSPEVRLRNNGSDTVYTAQIRYGYPGSVQQAEAWSGILPPGDVVTVSLSPIGAADGIQVMEFRLAEQDDQSTNNYRSVAFSLSSLPGENCPEIEMLAYPNPVYSGGTVCVKTGLQRAQESQIQLIDVAGRIVWSKDQLIRPGDTLAVATGGLSKGVYILVIAGDLNTEAVRFVVHEDEIMPASTGNCE